MSTVRVIKRYANRKLYDTEHSRYVTLDQISEMIRNGEEVSIIDNKSKEDLTSVTLAQIIFEEEKKQRSFLPLQAMRNIIQHGGEQFSHLVAQAQKRVSTIIRRGDSESPDEEPPTEQPAAAASEPAPEPEVTVEDHETYGSAWRTRDGSAMKELREWLQTQQKTVEEWQHRMDGRIRTAIGGIAPPFAGFAGDVRALGARLAELEKKLAAALGRNEEAKPQDPPDAPDVSDEPPAQQ